MPALPAGKSGVPGQKSRVHQSPFIIAEFPREIGRKNVVLLDYGVIKHVPMWDAETGNPAALDSNSTSLCRSSVCCTYGAEIRRQVCKWSVTKPRIIKISRRNV